MTLARAIELFKWGHCYARPRPRNGKEVAEAIQFLLDHPGEFTLEDLRWS